MNIVRPDAPGTVLELNIDSIATGGDGVGRDAAGRVVFVPRTAPGDRVRVQVQKARKRWARAETVELLEEGPNRREPPCPVYDQCGGCALQHLEVSAQREAKHRIVREALKRIGGLEPSLPEVAHGDLEFGYRNRVTFTLRRDGGGALFGYRSRRTPDEVLNLSDCPLAESPVRSAIGTIRGNLDQVAGEIPAGSDVKLTVRAACDGAIALHLGGGENGLGRNLGRLGSNVPGLVSFVHTDSQGKRTVLAGEAWFSDRWQGTRFHLGPDAFLQVNREVSALMDRELDALVGSRRGLVVGDLYAGVGARALRWAREGARVTAVEFEPEAVAAGRAAAAAEGLEVDFLEARVEDATSAYEKARFLVVNPPRAGLSPAVAAHLAGMRDVRGLAYVSCDPATLARDLGLLTTGWRISATRAFDAFPQTSHIETLVWMEPIHDRPRGFEAPGAID